MTKFLAVGKMYKRGNDASAGATMQLKASTQESLWGHVTIYRIQSAAPVSLSGGK